MKKIILALCMGLLITLLLSLYSVSVQSHIAGNVLRMHILANSDTPEDQALKLSVRDRLLRESGVLFQSCTTLEETRTVFTRERENLLAAATDEVRKNGYTYPVAVKLEKTYFPTKYYNNIALPAGEYEAVRVEIGSAAGQNWWCVMFPPLCFVDGSIDEKSADMAKMQAALGDDYVLLTPDEEGDVRIRFKIVDIFQSTSHAIRQALQNS